MATSEWEQAGAVVDRLWDRWPEAEICSCRLDDGTVRAWFNLWGHAIKAGYGPTYVTALIDLGRQWAQEGQNCPERDERGA